MIRKMKKEDADIFYYLAEQFYASDAVLHPIPKKHHIDAFNEIMRSNVYLEGYIFEYNDQPVGYAITSKMYSQEAGGIMLWIDEIYILEEYRSKGLGKEFFHYLKTTLDSSIVRLRLEVEKENERAIELYKSLGFGPLAYDQMILDIKDGSRK
ncbi:MAG: GNAT family N-acetyltransferase [Bacilli bacterium]|jgi:ribosomal protein S18 acetylase RimI-like enzyme|uniref:GNAT family N-acetyltransferase n=1 Tax=unclassified Ureibacillus TaxID=2638520 RepID=UPI0031588AC4